jgi:intron-binding protein aquarius
MRERDTTTGPDSPTTAPDMPPAKRVKSSADSRPKNAAASGRPTVDDLEGESEFASLARQHWLKTPKQASKAKAGKAKVKVKNDVLKREIWDILEKENFPLKSLLVLEGLQTLERLVPCKTISNVQTSHR